MGDFVCNLIKSEVTLNLIIGFFYSSLIGIIILSLTYLIDRKKTLEGLNIDLTRLKLALIATEEPINKLAELNGKQYRKVFGDVLDNIKISEDSGIDEFIIYEHIPMLPKLNDYLIYMFNNNVNKMCKLKIEKDDIAKIMSMSESKKKQFLIDNTILVSEYENFNISIARINYKLDYYRELTLQIISLNKDDLKSDNISAYNKFKVFKYCIDSLIVECEQLKKSFEILDVTIEKVQTELEHEINKNKKSLDKGIKGFTITIVISLVLLFIA